MHVLWKGRLFGTRNSEPFLYRWHLVGYNTSTVPDMKTDEGSLWVVYGKPDSKAPELTGEGGEYEPLNMGVRRYVSIKDYISRKKPYVYESYGKKAGISGYPLNVLPVPERGELWIGTSKGLYRLER